MRGGARNRTGSACATQWWRETYPYFYGDRKAVGPRMKSPPHVAVQIQPKKP